MNISDKLRELGYKTVPESFYQYIQLWNAWYQNDVKDFHHYTIWNGIEHVERKKLSAGMAKKAAEDWANMLMNEKVAITLEGKAEQDFFDNVCKENNFRKMMNKFQELAFALGTTAYVARVSGLPVNGEGMSAGDAKALKIDFVMADGIYPLAWENDMVTSCAFATKRVSNNRSYVYLQIHEKSEAGTYDIKNYVFDDTEGGMNNVDLQSSEVFQGIQPVFHTQSEKPLFVLGTPNIVNNIDPNIPMGISVYANGLDQLKFCDNVFNSSDNEIDLGRKRIMVKPEAVQSPDGVPFFDSNDIAFYILPEDATSGQTVQDINSSLRIQEHLTAMQMALNMFSMKCGFGPNHWKFDAGNITTATQVISANSEEFRTLKKHEIVLESVLTELARIILRLGNAFMGQHLNEDVEISIDFDDSIIEDDATEFSRDMTMLTSAIIKREEFRAKWMNEDIDTAREALPQLESMVEDESGADEV